MVKVGNFSVRIVEAGTKESFKEHNVGGNSYAEVEPNEEYLIELRQTTRQKLMAKFNVDGKDLGYELCFEGSLSPRYRGLWRRDGTGKETNKALKFKKPSLSCSPGQNAAFSFGKVSVSFFEAVPNGEKIPSIFAGVRMVPGNVRDESDLKKKIVRSGEGAITLEETFSMKPRESFKPGKLLQTVTIHYCTTVGLIQLGALPKPRDQWEVYTAKNPKKRARANQLRVEPQRIKQPAVVDTISGNILKPAVEYELFDLTKLPSDDDKSVSSTVCSDDSERG